MKSWILASLVFFGYALVLAPVLPGLQKAARRRAILAALAGFVLCLAARLTSGSALLQEWVMPATLLLTGYWTSGQLFAAPMPGAERALRWFDRTLGIDDAIGATPGWMRVILELAYASVYLLVPVALLIRFATVADANPEQFWLVVLVTDFICFGCLPWIQTRPPRAVSAEVPWQSGIRRLNEQVLDRTSIQHNTFPSGHAAEALASALLVASAPWPLAAAVAVVAVLISAGAVLGRYHYAADAIAGWAVAAAVWAAVT
jgi:membrane-associated phospholipid phosphatase